MTDESEIIGEAAQESPTIWGQQSDIDFLAPATSVSEYDEMLAEDGGICGENGANCQEDGIADLELE